MISNFRTCIHGPGLYSVVEGHIHLLSDGFFVVIFSSTVQGKASTNWPVSLWLISGFALIYETFLCCEDGDSVFLSLTWLNPNWRNQQAHTSLRQKKRRRVMTGRTGEKEIACGSNPEPPSPCTPPSILQTPDGALDSRCILSGVAPSVPRNKCSFCVYML